MGRVTNLDRGRPDSRIPMTNNGIKNVRHNTGNLFCRGCGPRRELSSKGGLSGGRGKRAQPRSVSSSRLKVNKNCCATKSGHDISCPYKEKFEANLKSGRSMLRPYKGRFEERAGFFSGLAPVKPAGMQTPHSPRDRTRAT